MNCVITALALFCPTADPSVDAQTVAEVFRSYGSEFKDVQFLYEGTTRPAAPDGSTGTTFQGSYTFRIDGATLIDLFMLDGRRPTNRLLLSLCKDQMEELDASPDLSPRLSEREPTVSPGGPGSFNRPDSPEQLFLAWFFNSHANPEEYGLEPQGWEEVDGRRCLVVLAYDSPRRKPAQQHIPRSFVKLWLDLERNGNPLRIDWYVRNQIISQTFVTLERLAAPKGRMVWFPSEAQTSSYGIRFEKGQVIRKTEPDFILTCKILPATIKFNQGFPDAYFSTKRHAFVTSDETLTKLRRELESSKPAAAPKEPSDPESLKRRMDDALTRADAQAARLEASSAARAGGHWSETILPWGALAIGVPLVGFLLYRSRSRR